MKSSAKTVDQYLKEIPEDRLESMEAVREIILKNLPEGYIEEMEWGAISYNVPLEVYSDTYNKKPLMYAGLASQKNYMALYLLSAYAMPAVRKELENGFAKAGIKLNMGGGCLRFKKLDDLPLDVIAKTISAVPMDEYVEFAKANFGRRKKK